jgi:ubiquinone biosynthesis protein
MTTRFQKSRWVVSGRFNRTPAEFRDHLNELGPTYILLGQFLALRPDLIPQKYCEALLHLADRASPIPWETVKGVLVEDFHAAPEDLFDFINPKPVSVSSLSQTYVARLKDGVRVAVKIQRPEIQARIMGNLTRPRPFERLFETSGIPLNATPQELTPQLAEWIQRKLNFNNELANMTRLNRLAAGSRIQRIPEPVPQLCSPRVITFESIQGIPIQGLLGELHPSESAENPGSTASLIDTSRFAVNLITASLTQIFRYQYFHSDPHPDHLIAMPDDVVGFNDFGLCDELDELVRERQMNFLSAVLSRDTEQIFNMLSELLIPGRETDMKALHTDFIAEMRAANGSHRNNKGSDDGRYSSPVQSPIAQVMTGILRVAQLHGIQAPPKTLALCRTLLGVEMGARQLETDVDLETVSRDFFSSLQVDEALRILEPDHIQAISLNLMALLRDAPGQLHQILSELSDGRFVINQYVSETPKVIHDRNRRTRLVVTAILTVSVSLLLTKPDLPVLFGISLAWPISILLVILYIWLFIQWRQMQ